MTGCEGNVWEGGAWSVVTEAGCPLVGDGGGRAYVGCCQGGVREVRVQKREGEEELDETSDICVVGSSYGSQYSPLYVCHTDRRLDQTTCLLLSSLLSSSFGHELELGPLHEHLNGHGSWK